MKILVLDDNRDRQETFKTSLIGNEVDVVATVEETIKCLTDEKYDVVFLDHDLDGQVYVPSGPGTGYEVAEWLRDHPDRKPKEIIIHSHNYGPPPSTHGVENMKKLLPEAECVPFIYLDTAWERW